MDKGKILERSFYFRPVQQVARELIGQRLVRIASDDRVAGIILETEAYDGEADLACHAHSGKTERNRVMYGEGGRAYVYFTYGMHWMLNAVCGAEEYPAAVLIRAMLPLENVDFIRRRRENIEEKHWCDGPAKLTKALAIDGSLNGIDLCDPYSSLIIEKGLDIGDNMVQRTARIGIQYAGEPWVSHPWRFIARPEDVRSMPGI